MIDDRTTNLNLPKPNQDNSLSEDVARLRAALDALDAAIFGKQSAIGYTPENVSNKGVSGGYASLDVSGKVPAAQLPSYVDDVVDVANFAALPATGESGKIYITFDTTPVKQWRWSGTVYSEIKPSPSTTDSVVEGAVNLYFTENRAKQAIGALFADVRVTPTLNGQSSLSGLGGYTVGKIDVYMNGIMLDAIDDYTASNGSTIVLNFGATTSDRFLVRKWNY